jgi:Uma2 family endonuclease
MATQPAIPLPVHRLDVETYNRMVASGALEDQRVELLDGVLVDMSPHSPPHSIVITRLMRHFVAAPRWWTQVQLSIEVPPDCEPEPDLAIFAHEPSPRHHPRTALLVVEVAVSSHTIDQGVKAAVYARAGIPTYWLVDVPGRSVEVRTDPGADGYSHCESYLEGVVVPSPLEGVRHVDLAALFVGLEGSN